MMHGLGPEVHVSPNQPPEQLQPKAPEEVTTHWPPFLQGWLSQTEVAHVGPEKPGGHVHAAELPETVQVPRTHGEDEHGVSWQYWPEYPAGHPQV